MTTNPDERLWHYYQVENTSGFDKGSQDKIRILSRAIAKATGPSDFICEIGLGNGQLLCDLSRNRKVMGIDLCESTIQRLKSKSEFKEIELTQGDITNLKPICKNKDINVFITIDVIEHLEENQLERACNDIYDILPKRGKWFINVPWNENLKDNEIFCPHCQKTFHRVGHKQSFDEQRLIRLMKSRGFKIPFIKRIFPSNVLLPVPLLLLYRIIARIYLKNYSCLFALVQKE